MLLAPGDIGCLDTASHMKHLGHKPCYVGHQWLSRNYTDLFKEVHVDSNETLFLFFDISWLFSRVI